MYIKLHINVALSKKIIALFFCFAFIFVAFCDIEAFISNARRGMMLFGLNVLPILFPFFFVSSLIIELGLFKRKGAVASVVAMSFLSGYPTGARMLEQLYNRGEITRTQAIRISTYTSTTSPVFIIATVGAALYQDLWLGIIIFISTILGALCNGLLYSRVKFLDAKIPCLALPNTPFTEKGISDAISQSINSSVKSIFAVGGLIIVFFIAAAPFGVVVGSVLEMTNGVFSASEIDLTGVWRAVVPCAIVSFGGVCVAMQGFVFQKTFNMPVWFYFTYKITHTVFACVICGLLVLVI